MSPGDGFLSFQRAKFKTRLPRGRLYTAGHMWLREAEDDVWQVGLTRFALRMLGEPVELELEVAPDAELETGQVVGWLEGFKAVTDLFTPLSGRFAGGNGVLDDDLDRVHAAPYDDGWIFAVRGTPGDDCVDTDGYAEVLESSIDSILGASPDSLPGATADEEGDR